MFDRIAKICARFPEVKCDVGRSEEYEAMAVTVYLSRGTFTGIGKTVDEAFDEIDKQLGALCFPQTSQDSPHPPSPNCPRRAPARFAGRFAPGKRTRDGFKP